MDLVDSDFESIRLWLPLTPPTISVDPGFVALICRRKVVPAKIGNGELAKDVIEDRRAPRPDSAVVTQAAGDVT